MTAITSLTLSDPAASTSRVAWWLVHHVPGRYRLRIPRLSQDETYAIHLHHLISELGWVTRARLNPAARSLIIEYEFAVSDLTTLLEQLDNRIQQADQAEIALLPLEEQNTVTDLLVKVPWERLGWSGLSLGLALLFPPLEWPALALVTGAVIVTAAMPVFSKAVHGLFLEGKATGALQESFWITLNTLRGDFLEPALSLSLDTGGETLRNLTRRNASQQQVLAQFVQQLEERQQVWVRQDHCLEQRPLQAVRPGDVLVIHAGERILVDGKIIEGTALIDQCSLMGESVPILHRSEQRVYASSLVLEGRISVVAEQVLEDTRAGLAIALTEMAPVHDTRIADYASQVSDVLILPILACSGGFALAGDLTRAATVLMLDCATGTELSVPTAMLAALQQAHNEGIYISSGRDLELLAKADTIIFDKTGTLTQPNNQVLSIEIYTDQVTVDQVLGLAASLELGHPHPIARAIRDAAQAQALSLQPCQNWVYHNGMGITAEIEGQLVIVGNLKLLQQQGVDLEHMHQQYLHLRQGDRSHLYVVRNGLLLGAITYQGTLRSHCAEVITALQDQDFNVYMMTGDHPQAAYAMAETLGISRDRVYADLLPAQKAEWVRHLQNEGKTVVYIGDGINDGPALAHADISMTLMDSSVVAHEVANVVLLENDLRDLLHALQIGRQAMTLVYQNTAIVTLPNISAVVAALFFGLDPALAVLISDGATLLAELNSVRALSDDLAPVFTGSLQFKS